MKRDRIAVVKHGAIVGSLPPTFDLNGLRALDWLEGAPVGAISTTGRIWFASSLVSDRDLEAIPGYEWSQQVGDNYLQPK